MIWFSYSKFVFVCLTNSSKYLWLKLHVIGVKYVWGNSKINLECLWNEIRIVVYGSLK